MNMGGGGESSPNEVWFLVKFASWCAGQELLDGLAGASGGQIGMHVRKQPVYKRS